MAFSIQKRLPKTGASPGTLIHVGDPPLVPVTICMAVYGPDHHLETNGDDIDWASLPPKEATAWVAVTGIHDKAVLDRIGRQFGIHSLTLEDIMNAGHRPKMEILDDYLFVTLKAIYCDKAHEAIKYEQISLLLIDRCVISFQEIPSGLFDAVRERLRRGRGRMRQTGADYLLYVLMDAVIDNYFETLDVIGARIDELEEGLLEDPRQGDMSAIYELKRETIRLRKHVWPLREMINQLSRSDLIGSPSGTGIYLRDLYDHTVQALDTIEAFRDVLAGLLDLSLSMASHRMNEVMKVLTIIATIFIPVTFIAGVYGMNFKHMPELDWPWGYAAVMALMAGIILVMVLFFRRRKWL